MEADALYRVNLPAFEGPLDLLLYLIKKNELDIYDIPISTILQQYLNMLDLLVELNLDVAGEFLLMAAMLTAIKSRQLLPQSVEEEEELEDPRTPLVEKLLEYQRYKEASQELAQRSLLNRDVFQRQQPALNLPDGWEPPMPELNLFDLVEALERVLTQAQARGVTHRVNAERFSVVKRIQWLHERIRTAGACSFRRLMLELEGRMDIILTFLAMLELLKARVLCLEPLEGEGEEQDWALHQREPGQELDIDLSQVLEPTG